MNYYYRLKIAYRGTGFEGWQKQGHTERTLQAYLEKQIQDLFKIKACKTIASGRTDSGVHAIGQIVKLELPLQLSKDSFLQGLNKKLMPIMKIIEVENVTDEFHPVYQAKAKEYRYYFSTAKSDPQNWDQFTSIDSWKEKWSLEEMQKICKMFIGEHDFVHLRCLGTPTSTTVRKIYDCSVDEVKLLKDGPVAVDPLYVFTVTGSGFLKQMVRMMVGSCWDVLKGGRDLKQLQNSLNGIAPDQAWSVAPPSGLYLYRVDY